MSSTGRSRAVAASSAAEDRIFGILGGALRFANVFSSRLAGRFLYWLWCHPIRHRPSNREQAFKRSLSSGEFSVGGTTYRYYAMGSGPVVLAMHGWDGRGTQMMSFFEPLAAAGYRVVTFDAQAHGESPGRQTNGVVIRGMVLELARTVGGLNAIVAHSMGGAFAMAALDALAVQKMVLIAPPRSLHEAYSKVKARLGVPEQAERHFLAMLERDFPNVWNRFSIDQMVPHLSRVHGLVIQDRDDEFVRPEEGLAVHQRWPGSQLHMTSGLGHRKILRSEDVIRQVVDFLGPAPDRRGPVRHA